MDIRAKGCRAGWKVAYDLSYRQHTVLAHFEQRFPVPTCKIVRVSVRTTQLDFTRARAKVRWFARYAKLLVVFWGFGKPCCDVDGKWSEQSIFWTEKVQLGTYSYNSWQVATESLFHC